MSDEIVHVAVAVISDDQNQVLISKRPEDTHLGGLWEFPGGKVEPGETVEAALCREIEEELDIRLSDYQPLIKITHHYNDKSVLLDVWEVKTFSGIAKGNEGQLIDWKLASELDPDDFPEADIAIIKAINLPEYCLITGDFDTQQDYATRLDKAVDNGIRLVQCRITGEHIDKHGRDVIEKVVRDTVLLCDERNVTLFLNCPGEIRGDRADNLHLKSTQLMASNSRPECRLLSASCHNETELSKAIELGVDFVFLSPVLPTRSHPGARPLGWQSFGEYLDKVNIPVYALGGVTRDDLELARLSGAQGVAGISTFWCDDA